jgi:hypothetical protein
MVFISCDCEERSTTFNVKRVPPSLVSTTTKLPVNGDVPVSISFDITLTYLKLIKFHSHISFGSPTRYKNSRNYIGIR